MASIPNPEITPGNNDEFITRDLGLIMSGGGARAAYQVGFLRSLARHHEDLHFPIITGVSSGAINAAYLANESGHFRDKVERLANIWSRLTIDHVFRVDSMSIARHVLSWGMRLVMGGASNAIRTRSLVDSEPVRRLMHDILKPEGGRLTGIERNIREGWLKAVAITASSYTTGQSITWVQGHDVSPWVRAHRKSVFSDITIDHIMASASLPMFFPSIYVDGSWYGDGGIRLTAPLSPAIHMGARRLFAISTRHLPPVEDIESVTLDDYPSPARVMGAMYNAIFLDVFDNDALRLERVNRLLERLPQDQWPQGLAPVKLLLLRPSEDLGALAGQYEPQLPASFRFMTRGWGTRERKSADMLSLVMFQPDYLQHLIELGERDAEARLDDINAFFEAAN